jgi:DNA-binding transcriptional regulator YdaS (Cro superfamily)
MMNLETYLSTVDTAVSLASKLGITPGFVSQWRTGVRPIPIERCVAIEQATEGVVTRRDLRPDDWFLIWPELAERLAEPNNK